MSKRSVCIQSRIAVLAAFFALLCAAVGWADPPSYCLACIEPAEGKSGLRVGTPNLGNRLGLFFLDATGNLVSSGTAVTPHFEGKRLGVSSVMKNGLLFGRAGDALYLNGRLRQLTLAGLIAAPGPLDNLLNGHWKAVLQGREYDHRVKAIVGRLGLAQDSDLERYFCEAMNPLRARHIVSPEGDVMWFILDLADRRREARGSHRSPLFYNLLGLMRLDGKGTDTVLLGADKRWRICAPTWSPDASRLAFFRMPAKLMQALEDTPHWDIRRERWQLCVVDIRSGDIQPYGPNTCATYHARWSPDGSRLLFSTIYDDPTSPTRRPFIGISVVDLRTRHCKKLSGLRAKEHARSWAPAGDRYLFLAFHPPNQPGAHWLYGVGQVDPPSQRILLDATRLNVRNEIVWSPHGKYIAYASAPQENGGWVDRIVVVESSGGGKAREIVRSKPQSSNTFSRRYHNLTWLHLPAQ